MSLSRSPTCTQRSGAANSDVDWRRFSSQRKLSFCSIGTRVGLTLRLSAFVPLNFCRDQNFTAASPSGRPSLVTASEACMSRHTQRVHANLTCFVTPSVDGAGDPDGVMALALERELGRILEDQYRAVTGPHTLACRCEVTRQDLRLADPFVGKETVSGLVLAQSWQANGRLAPRLRSICPTSRCKRCSRRASAKVLRRVPLPTGTVWQRAWNTSSSKGSGAPNQTPMRPIPQRSKLDNGCGLKGSFTERLR